MRAARSVSTREVRIEDVADPALGEPAGVQGGRAEAVAQRLVPAPAAPALPARRVVVHHNGVAHRHAPHAAADRDHLGR